MAERYLQHLETLRVNEAIDPIPLILFTFSGCLPALFGEDTKAAEQAFATCKHDAALEAIERALATITDGDEIYHALTLKAAVLKESGDTQASQAVYPTILLVARVIDGKPLSRESMERNIDRHIANAQRAREESGLPGTCKTVTP